MSERSITEIREDLDWIDAWRTGKLQPSDDEVNATTAALLRRTRSVLADVPGLLGRLEEAESDREFWRGIAQMQAEVSRRSQVERDSLRAQVEAVTRDHFWREIDTRSAYCDLEGFSRDCRGYGDPACSEACFETIRICNGCGTRDKCKIREAINSVVGSS